jgi:hypothetical protein
MLDPQEKAALRKSEGLRYSTWQWPVGSLRQKHQSGLLLKQEQKKRRWRGAVAFVLAALLSAAIAVLVVKLRT